MPAPWLLGYRGTPEQLLKTLRETFCFLNCYFKTLTSAFLEAFFQTKSSRLAVKALSAHFTLPDTSDPKRWEQ